MHQVVLRTYYHYAYAKTLSQLITVFLYGVFQFVVMEMNNQTGVETYQVFNIYFVEIFVNAFKVEHPQSLLHFSYAVNQSC